MADYTRVNLKSDVEDMAPKHGMEGIESRFARTNLELAKSGLSYFRLDPDYRAPFGHTHSEQEEVYVVSPAARRIAVGDEVVELGEWDAVRVGPGRAARHGGRLRTAPRSSPSARRTRRTRTPTCSPAGGLRRLAERGAGGLEVRIGA